MAIPSHMNNFFHLMGRYQCNLLPILLVVVTLFVLPFSQADVYAQDGTTVHIVTPGENLSSIARRYNVSVAVLMGYNSIRNANLIRPGQRILIPNTIHPQSTSTSPALPSAQPTRYSRDLSVESQTIRPTPVPITAIATSIPPSRGGATGFTTIGEPVYTVRRGDTLSGIAAQFGVSITGISRRNNLRSMIIYVSQRLIIPTTSSAPLPFPTVRPSAQESQMHVPVATPVQVTTPIQGETPAAPATPVPVVTDVPTATPHSTAEPASDPFPTFLPPVKATVTPTPGGPLQ
ncbi:MAG: LysM peptidoglycan-binding domain-containing protein [Caldilineaceae bacterium]|nr:LysM peptidoglycan-binding domain-containing protein [Caldilineaceae bacterium]